MTQTAVASTKGTISVYVRKGDSDAERTISFNPPKEVTQDALFRLGYAIDGKSAVLSVAQDENGTMYENLAASQRYLIIWFRDLGYGVEFK